MDIKPFLKRILFYFSRDSTKACFISVLVQESLEMIYILDLAGS